MQDLWTFFKSEAYLKQGGVTCLYSYMYLKYQIVAILKYGGESL